MEYEAPAERIAGEEDTGGEEEEARAEGAGRVEFASCRTGVEASTEQDTAAEEGAGSRVTARSQEPGHR